MQSRYVAIVLCGIVSGLLPLVPGSLAFAVIAPFVPLMLIGMAEGTRSLVHASCVAVAVALTIGGDGLGFRMGLFVAVPCCLFLRRVLSFRELADGQKEWFPTLRALCELTLLVGMAIFLLSILVSHQYDGGMQEMLNRVLAIDNSALEPELAEILGKLLGEYSFVIFAVMGWMWVLTFWITAYWSHNLLVRQGKALRPELQISPRGVPSWVLLALVISAVLVLIGGVNDVYIGKVLFLIFLLPYFLAGMGAIHSMSRVWQPRKLWLFCIYIILVFIFWTLLIPIALGFYLQVSEMLDKPKRIG